MTSIHRRLIAMAIFGSLVAALAMVTQQYGSIDWLVQNESELRQSVERRPWLAWAIGLAAYTAVSFVPGTGGKAVVFGWLYGFWAAVVLVVTALTIAAVGTFLASRYLFREIAEARFASISEQINHGLERDGSFYLLMVRLAHVPYTLVNYGAGVTSLSLSRFTWTTLVGLTPGTMVFVFLGTQIPTLQEIAKHGIWGLLDPMLIVVLIVALLLPATIHWGLRRYGGFDALSSSEAR